MKIRDFFFLANLIICSMLLSGCGFVGGQKNKIKEQVENAGYDAEFVEDGNDFYIEQDGIQYYFKKKLFRYKLDRIIVEAYTNNETVVDGKATITIIKKSDDVIEVDLSDTRWIKSASGKEETIGEAIHFLCDESFDEDSIKNDNPIWGTDKAAKAYKYITSNFITKEEFCDIYEAAFEFENSFDTKK